MCPLEHEQEGTENAPTGEGASGRLLEDDKEEEEEEEEEEGRCNRLER